MSTAPQVIWDTPAPPKKAGTAAVGPQVIWDEQAPAEKPGFFNRLSQQVFGTPHPLDQAASEASALYEHPLDTLGQAAKQAAMIPMNLANRALPIGEAVNRAKAGDYLGAARTIAMGAPNLARDIAGGPQFAEDVANKNYPGAAGTLAGDIAQVLGPPAARYAGNRLQAAMQGGAERMYQSALKPPPGSYSTPEVRQMVNTGLEEKIPVSQAGAQKLHDLVGDLNDKVQAQIQAGSAGGATVNKYAVTGRLGDTAQRFATQVNPEADLSAVSRSGNEFLANQPNEIPAARAQALKSGTYQQISSRAYGELDTATTEAQKALARGIKEELQIQFPEIGDLNARESRLLGLDDALERAVRRTSNRDIFSLGGKIASGAGAAVGAAVGGEPGAAAGAVGVGIMHHYLTDPGVQSRLAIAVSRVAKIPPEVAQAAIATYVAALAKRAGAPGAFGRGIPTQSPQGQD